MSDNPNPSNDGSQNSEPNGPDNGQNEPAQDETDWKSEARKWEQRAKENREAAQRLAEIEESQQTETEKLTRRAEQAEAELNYLRSQSLRTEVALEKGLTAQLAARLSGESKEDLLADADELLSLIPADNKPRKPEPDPSLGRDKNNPVSNRDLFASALQGRI